MRALRSLSVFAVVLGSGCRDLPPRADGPPEPSVRDSAGVTIVENGAPVGNGVTNGWRLASARVVGDPVDGSPFGEIRAVDLASDGSLLVLDRSDGRVTVWDGEGRLVRSFGGRGSGPGEVVTPGYVRALEDGTVVVGEVFPPRLHWYDERGDHLRTDRVRPQPNAPALLATMAEWKVSRTGEVLVRLSYASPSHLEGTPVVLARLLDGGAIDTVLRWTEKNTPARLPRIFEADWSWDAVPGAGVVVSPGSRYELRRHDERGKLTRRVTMDAPPVPVTEELEQRAVDRFYERFAGEDVSEALLRDLGDRLEVAPVLPAVQGIRVSEPDGRIWVEVPTGSRTGELEEPGGWDLFEADGSYLGRLSPPDGFRLEGVHGDTVYGIERDELGVTRARVYRVVAEASTGAPSTGT